MKRIFNILCVIILFAEIMPIYAKSAENSGISAYILMEAKTGYIAEEYNSDVRLNVGYLSKLMTVLIAAEDIEKGLYSPDDEVTASPSVTGTKGAVVWLQAGDKITVGDLLKSVIIGNANDAAIVLAENSGGSVEDFVVRMNAEAERLGMRDTVFCSPCGYYDGNEYSTAHDIALICRELVNYDMLTDYFRTWRDFVKSGQTELVNENTLSRTYERHIGFKACHSEQSGYCAAEAGRNEKGIVYISVVLGAEDEDISLGKAKKLINTGFGEYKITATMFPDEMLRPLEVRNGTENFVEMQIQRQDMLVVPVGVKELSSVVVIPEYIDAPVRKGQKIGMASFYNGDVLVCEIPITAKEDVDRLSFGWIFGKTLLELIK
ncbi:MAG: D-alanyl-D-alanine carboxypeptidase [Ruminococcus sp.]|nr:D-alanyl-D-alanine carboxypeptidase [Ruminococcus sp.]